MLCASKRLDSYRTDRTFTPNLLLEPEISRRNYFVWITLHRHDDCDDSARLLWSPNINQQDTEHSTSGLPSTLTVYKNVQFADTHFRDLQLFSVSSQSASQTAPDSDTHCAKISTFLNTNTPLLHQYTYRINIHLAITAYM
jgi:hypothetical protein